MDFNRFVLVRDHNKSTPIVIRSDKSSDKRLDNALYLVYCKEEILGVSSGICNGFERGAHEWCRPICPLQVLVLGTVCRVELGARQILD